MTKKPYKRGLVVGKFCPLHRGHEMLIEHARDACEELLIVSYTKPEFAGCEPAKRRAWLQALFPFATILVVDDASLQARCGDQGIPFRHVPGNDAADAVHREFVGWLCHDLLGTSVDAVFTSEDYGDGFAAALSIYFSKRLHAAHTVRHICVDKARGRVPVSGTAVRADPHAYRGFLSPVVYAGFVRRICLLGGESSGKTTLAAALAERCSTAWVAEYGRELWDRKEGKLEFDDMLRIGQEQVMREDRVSEQAARWLVCDTSPLTTLFYSLEMFGKADAGLYALAERTYDIVFLCAPDFPFVQDGTRRDDAFRWRQHAWYEHELRKRGMAFTMLQGPVAERIETAMASLKHQDSALSRVPPITGARP